MNTVPLERRLGLGRDVDVVHARQVALRLVREQEFPAHDQARVDLVVAELAMNVLRHASRGEIVLSLREESRELAIVCSDAGPGIQPPAERPGLTSSLGLGLALVRELADDVEIESTEQGTWIRATVRPRSK